LKREIRLRLSKEKKASSPPLIARIISRILIRFERIWDYVEELPIHDGWKAMLKLTLAGLGNLLLYVMVFSMLIVLYSLRYWRLP
jgi:hypothetical protein